MSNERPFAVTLSHDTYPTAWDSTVLPSSHPSVLRAFAEAADNERELTRQVLRTNPAEAQRPVEDRAVESVVQLGSRVMYPYFQRGNKGSYVAGALLTGAAFIGVAQISNIPALEWFTGPADGVTDAIHQKIDSLKDK